MYATDCINVRGVARNEAAIGGHSGDALAFDHAPAVAASVTERVARARSATVDGAARYEGVSCRVTESDDVCSGSVVGASVRAGVDVYRTSTSDQLKLERGLTYHSVANVLPVPDACAPVGNSVVADSTKPNPLKQQSVASEIASDPCRCVAPVVSVENFVRHRPIARLVGPENTRSAVLVNVMHPLHLALTTK